MLDNIIKTTIKLNTGAEMPSIGLGTWKSAPGLVHNAITTAIDCGYRHFDCALVYGNEHEIGDALNQAIDSGKVKREQLFVTTKLWNTFHQRERVPVCLKKSLDALRLDYVDLYLIHWPMGYKEGNETYPRDENNHVLVSDIDYLETWWGMEDVLKSGKVKAIGVSNFNSEQLIRLMKNSSTIPAVNQVECHLYLNQTKMIEFCRKHDIVVTAYGPLGSPNRNNINPKEPTLIDDPVVKRLAIKHKKTVAQILIRFQLQRGIACIPKSVTPERIQNNIDVFSFDLPPADMAELEKLDRNLRLFKLLHHGPNAANHQHYPFRIPF